MIHKSGFVNILGKPNVGKSTLMYALVGEKLSIITPKPQTTRHRIMGIMSGEDYQIVYSDTPGIIKPAYQLQKSMMQSVESAFLDADIILYVTDIFEENIDNTHGLLNKLQKTKIPILLIINKIDLGTEEKVKTLINYWKNILKNAEIIVISAKKKFNIKSVFKRIIELLPVSPAYFPKDELTDRPLRFFVSEIIREKIFLRYQKEVPYSCEVLVTLFKEEEKITHIKAEIYTEKESQKGIIIGHKAEAIKWVGTEARKDIEAFIGKKVFLELFVKVSSDWRNSKNQLRKFGYL